MQFSYLNKSLLNLYCPRLYCSKYILRLTEKTLVFIHFALHIGEIKQITASS